MALKHEIKDADVHFVLDADSKKIVKQTTNKVYLMQYDKNSEEFTFDVPRYIENHDMSQCDCIQVHYENTSSGTSVSTRKTYRGVRNIKLDTITVSDEIISFGWLVPETATTFAGVLKFQLKFICYDNEDGTEEGYKLHSDVNEDVGIKAGLAYAESEIDPATTATLQSLEIVEIDGGIDVILDGVHHPLYNGEGGGGQLPEIGTGDNTKIVEVKGGVYSLLYPSASSIIEYLKTITVTAIDENSTDGQYVSAKAVYDLVDTHRQQEFAEIDALVGEGV